MNDAAKGIACPGCGCRHLNVVRTRHAPGDRIMRVRECRHCGRKLVTYEASAGQAAPPALPELTPSQRETLMARLLEWVGLGSFPRK